jgi:hypothetical protein
MFLLDSTNSDKKVGYQPCTNFIPVSVSAILYIRASALYQFYTSFKVRFIIYIRASYKPKVSLGPKYLGTLDPSTRTRLVSKCVGKDTLPEPGWYENSEKYAIPGPGWYVQKLIPDKHWPIHTQTKWNRF